MKKIALLAATLLLLCVTGNAQRQMDQRLVRQLMGKNHSSVSKDIIAPEKAEYYTNGDAIVTYRDKFTYDKDEYFMTEKETDFLDLGSWIPARMESYEYDFDYNLIETLIQRYENGTWVRSERIVNTYEDYGIITLIKEQTYTKWDGDQWLNDTKFIYDYDPTITILVKVWENNVWMENLLYTVEEGNGESTVLLQYWQGGAWQNQERQTYTYGDNDVLETITYQQWVNNLWQNEQRDTYYHDIQGHVIKIVKTLWENGSWSQNQSKTIAYVLNKDGNCENAVCESNLNNPDNTDIEMFYNGGESMLFPNVHEVTMTYFDVTQVAEQSGTTFRLWPNPVQDRLMILGEGMVKAEIYSINGQKTLESVANEIDVKGLAAGTYLVKILRDNGQVETQKLVVK